MRVILFFNESIANIGHSYQPAEAPRQLFPHSGKISTITRHSVFIHLRIRICAFKGVFI